MSPRRPSTKPGLAFAPVTETRSLISTVPSTNGPKSKRTNKTPANTMMRGEIAPNVTKSVITHLSDMVARRVWILCQSDRTTHLCLGDHGCRYLRLEDRPSNCRRG